MVTDPEACRLEGELAVQLDDSRLTHRGDRFEGSGLALLPQELLEDFQQADRGNDQAVRIFDRFGEAIGVGPVREVLEPGRGVDDVQTRSPSRSTLESTTLAAPRSCRGLRTGTSSTRPSSARASTFWPGASPSFSRTALGMTTWYLGEMVTVFDIRQCYRSMNRTTKDERLRVEASVTPLDGARARLSLRLELAAPVLHYGQRGPATAFRPKEQEAVPIGGRLESQVLGR